MAYAEDGGQPTTKEEGILTRTNQVIKQLEKMEVELEENFNRVGKPTCGGTDREAIPNILDEIRDNIEVISTKIADISIFLNSRVISKL